MIEIEEARGRRADAFIAGGAVPAGRERLVLPRGVGIDGLELAFAKAVGSFDGF